jgi:hypothetical protein
MGASGRVSAVTKQKKVSDHVRFADETRVVAFRMPKSLEKRLVKLQGRLFETKNGSRVTLTEALITAAAKGLDAFDEETRA